MEGYTARDVLIVMRLDLAESIREIDAEIEELSETLEFSGIAGQLLTDGDAAAGYSASRRWLETVSNRPDLERDLEELQNEREELAEALRHLEQRLTGRTGP